MKRLVVLFLLAVIGCGCSAGMLTTKVSDQTPKEYNGFSIVPPRGDDWFVVALKDHRVEFEKKLRSGATQGLAVERYDVGKSIKTPEEFLQYVNGIYFVPGAGIEFVSHESRLDPRYGSYCVAYSYKYKQFGNNMAFRFQEGHGYSCLHPQASDKEFKIVHAKTYAPGQEDESSDAAVAAFFDGFTFKDYRK